ncbi:DNA-directed DNA polymerase [Candidatus Woesearchaeota archaeon]|nr:DNA-directed DNA polymerase [Candidatus Woesearchaeota archaeon]
MVTIRFFPLDIDYKIVGNKPVIRLFGKTSEGEQICVMDNSFAPYFYVLPDEKNSLEELKIYFETFAHDEIKIIKAELIKKQFWGKEVTAIKITLENPGQVPKLRPILREQSITYLEGDILFVRRYLIDKEIVPTQEYVVEGEEAVIPGMKVRCIDARSIVSGEALFEKPKILAFDIEAYPSERRTFDSPILMISFYGNNYQKVITWKHFKTKHDYVEFVNSEAELLQRFKEVVESFKPDVVTGYFSDGFDFPYIIERAKKYKVKLDLGLDRSAPEIGKGRSGTVKITGINHLDVYQLTRNILLQSLKTDSYTLNEVAKELLGEEKKQVDILELGPAWDKNNAEMLDRFCDYNLQDSLLTYQLCEKLLPGVIELVKIIGLPINDVSRFAMSQMVEWFLINNAKKRNIIAPNKPTREELGQRMSKSIQGAFVLEPVPGLYKNILLFDFMSLYPTIVSAHNISGPTLRCDCCRDTAEPVPLEGQKIWFCQKKKGFLPTMIYELIERRLRVKQILKETKNPFLNARQLGLKLLANSFWGYIGFTYSRWYSFDAAASITAYARYYIKKVIDRMQEEGFNVVYSDTDSVLLTAEKKTKEDALKVSEDINKNLPGMMELEFEGLYPAGIFVSTRDEKSGAKKRYALIDEKDNLIIKGFETVRRNTSQIAKEVQKKVLAIVLKEQNKEKAYKYVRTVIEKVRRKEFELDNFIIKTQITKPIEDYDSIGPHVAVAKRMMQRGITPLPGTVLQYIITAKGTKIRDKAREVHECTKEDIDAEYYIENQIVPVVEKIFEVLGYTRDDLIALQEQSKLDSFF